ncbi:MAG TPA: SsrA-binding protein SmpB [Alphaproteobacteria bacterium]
MAGGDLKQRIVAQNRKARHNYIIEDTVEAGLVLVGTEVKSLREGRASLGDAFAERRDGEMVLVNSHIAHYPPANRLNHDPLRPRKLLLHRREIERLRGLVERRGYTLVPLKLYFDERGRAKVELGIARGRKLHDKREREKELGWQRDKARLMRARS